MAHVSRFKNVLFEINSTESSGVFEVNAKFMGVNTDKVELLFQVIEYSAHHCCEYFLCASLQYCFQVLVSVTSYLDHLGM